MANHEWLQMQQPISSTVEFVTHAKMGRTHQCAPEMKKNQTSTERTTCNKIFSGRQSEKNFVEFCCCESFKTDLQFML